MFKHLQKLLLFAALCVPWVMQSQSLGDYTFSTGTDASMWIAVPSTQTSLISPGAGDYGVSTVHDIGFAFPFGTSYYTQFSVNADGNLRFGSTVTGTSNYTTPFSSSNASVNAPKINPMGCDGFLSDSGYVRMYNTADANDDSLLVIEFATSTYNNTSRASLLKWQVQLYPNGNINIVFASTQPPILPAVTRQCGMSVDGTDIWLIDASHAATHYTAGQSTTIAIGSWPDANRYYSFVRPVITCPAPSALTVSNITLDGADLTWTPMGSESQWEVICNNQSYFASTNSYSLSNLEGNTLYNVSVRAICGADDTSFATNSSFRTPCVSISQLPYSNDFENEPYYASGVTSYAEAFPNCWTRINDATGTYNYYPYISTTASYLIHGGKSMYWYHSTSSTYANNQYAVLPPIDLDVYSISDLTLSFFGKTTATAAPYPQFITGVMTDPTDVTTFVPIDTVTLTTTPTQYVISLSDYTGTGNYIAIRSPRTSTSTAKYASLDDIFLTDEWCDTPGEITATAGLDEVTVSWEPNDGSSFTVFLGMDTIANVTDTFYTFLNLDANTVYNFGVANECASSNSMYVTGSIRTLCGYIDSLPYTYGFEDMATGSSTVVPDIPCWHHLNNGTSNPGYPYISSTTPHSGSRNLYWYLTTTTGTYGDYEIVVLPAVDTNTYPINTLQLTFWARPNSTSYNPVFQVGVMTDPNDPTTFQLVDDVHVDNVTTWQEFTVMLGAFTGSGNFVALRALRPSSSWYAYTDDFTLDLMPACPPVADLHIDSLSVDWAQISWVDMGNGTSWVVEYDTVDFVPGTGTSAVVDNANDANYLMAGLDTGFTYYVYVRADCGSDTSAFEGFTVTTLASMPATVPYTCDFEGNLTNGWDFIQEGQDNYWTVGTDTQNGGTKSMYITNNGTTNSYSGSASYSFATRTFNLAEAGEYAYSYDWKCEGESSFDFMRVALVPAGTNINAGGYSGFDNSVAPNGAVPAGGIALDGGGRLNLQSSWQTQTGTFTITNPGTYMWVFMWRNDGSVYYVPPAAIDNVNMIRNTCPAPIDFTSVYATTDSIILSWQPLGSETQWIVSDDSTSQVVTDTFFVAENLNPNTEYNFVVRSLCGDGDTSLPVSLSVRTDCGSISVLPYIESFEGLPVGTSSSLDCGVPCWARLDNASTYHFGYVGSPSSWPAGGHTGTGFLYYYMPTTSVTYADWILTILPPIDITTYPLDGLQVSFWVKMNSATTSGDIQVGVISNVNDATTFIPLDTVSVSGNVYDMKTAYLSSYVDTANASHIAIKFFRDASTTTYYFLDDVTIEQIPDCPPVSEITLAGMTSDSLYITWTENGNATTWNVEYGPAGFTLGNGTTDVVTSLPYGIGGLTANTAYDVYITPECNSGVSATRRGTFRTDCGATPVPFTENFDTWSSTVADPLPNCWEKHTNYTSNYPYASTSQSHSPGKSMYMYSTASTYSYMVLPSFDLPVDSTMVSFWLYATSTAYSLQVGVMTNPSDVSTFTTVATVAPSATSTWEEFEVPLSSYTGTGTRIAIMSPNGISSNPYLDDLTVARISECPRVTQLMATTVLLDSATVVWSDSVNTTWYVEYDTVDFTPGTDHTPIQVTDTFCVIPGLSAGTLYHVYVYPDCNGDIAVRHTTFTTLSAPPATVPFSCDFEAAGVNGWDLISGNQNNYWIVGNATNNGGSQSLYVTDNGTANNYSGSASYSFAVRTFNLQAGNYVCTYDWKCQGESSFDFLRAALVPAVTNIEAGSYCGFDNASAMPAGSIALDGGYRLNLQGTTWTNQVTEFTLSAPGTYKMVFLWRNDASVYNIPPAAIDNVQLSLNNCPMPGNMTLSNLTQTSTVVSWEELGNASTWEYQLDNNAPVIVTDTFCTLTGLAANTVYSFHVRSICGQGDSSMWSTYSFRTPCGYLSMPYTEDFENESSGSSSTGSAFVSCWNRLNNGTSYGGYPYVGNSTTYNHTNGGTKGLYWYNSTTATTYGDYQCVILPPVDPNTGVDSLQLTFWAKASSTSYVPEFQIGVMTDPNNINSFVGLDTVTVTSGTTWMQIEVPLSAYTGNGQFVAVKADRAASYWYAYVDDFTLDYVPSCLVPHNMVSTASTTSSLTVDWTDLDTPGSWEIEYGPAGYSFGSTEGTSTVVSSHPATVNGLTPMTSYDFYVRAICGAGDTSRWSLASTFSTAMCDNAGVFMNYDTTLTTSTSSYSPIGYSTYNYSYVQTIVDSAYLANMSADIVAMAFEPTVTAAGDKFEGMTVYLSNVAEDNLSNGWILPNTTDHVFVKVIDNASFSYTTTGQHAHAFDTVFTWDGHSNILVSVIRNNGSWSSGATFAAHNHSAAKARYVYQDGGPYDYTNPSANGTAITTVGDIYLITCGVSCPKPTTLPATDVTYQSATLNWNSTATDFEVAVKAVTEATWPAEVAVSNATSYAVSGLAPATNYQFRVRAICDATEALISDWVEGTFVTDSLPCFVPDGLQVVSTGYTTATLQWNADASQNQWSIHVWNSANDFVFDAQTNPFTVTGLAQNLEYNVAVKAVCGGGYTESEYSDTITFTTGQCAQVTGVNVTGITSRSAVVNWTPTGAPRYKVEYGDRGFPQGTGTTIYAENGQTTVTLDNLVRDNNYSVFVMAICEEGVEGAWSERYDFATLDEDAIDVVNGNMNLSIYPNPTSDATTIALSGVNGEVQIVIVDMNGRTVMSDSMSCEGDCTKRMEVSGLAQGAYFVRVSGEGVNQVKKLVVK